MKIHHINCGTMCPASARLVSGEGGLFERARMVCHCLLIETTGGLVLVDTGLGTQNVEDPRNLGRGFVRRSAPKLDRAETALAQVERLGYRQSDVRHILPTHLDLDHVGGLADFPDAEIHVYRAEHTAAMAATPSRYGYRPSQWQHGARWSVYDLEGDSWLGFGAVRSLRGLDAEIALIPLVGHTAGHCAVAVKEREGWLLHAGDAYFSHRELDLAQPREPLASGLFNRLRSVDNVTRRDNVARLRQLRREHPEIEIFCAHSAREYDRLVAAAGSPATGLFKVRVNPAGSRSTNDLPELSGASSG